MKNRISVAMKSNEISMKYGEVKNQRTRRASRRAIAALGAASANRKKMAANGKIISENQWREMAKA
jgi:hypothetical protein